MAGHSHSANIKYRKDRQDSARSQLFVKLRRKLENIVREEGKISEKSLSLARENKFPKEKVYQIWEKIRQEIYSAKQKNASFSSRFLYQAQFGIVIYLEEDKISQEVINQLNLKELPLALLSRHFQLIYSLKIELKKENNNLEEYLLTNLPLETWEKMNYDKQKQTLFSADKETINRVKNLIKDDFLITLKEEKKYWKAFFSQTLNNQEEKNYYSQLQKKLENIQFYTNVEK
ncbi:MAG: hypothetical protein I3273_05620 [Candidatus Moeniiplasma glomeromycotorum]|nr:hypothetical protein [Candidatus Moeniiplasma glomeromycotorum]MCE8168047.1 hypothetical protein [Candidatus Moeniiplasma glomeromycotorum]MCE8169564.1 hypothetical protein [Candidatus Moeniiplasma glomeromycotorum]